MAFNSRRFITQNTDRNVFEGIIDRLENRFICQWLKSSCAFNCCYCCCFSIDKTIIQIHSEPIANTIKNFERLLFVCVENDHLCLLWLFTVNKKCRFAIQFKVLKVYTLVTTVERHRDDQRPVFFFLKQFHSRNLFVLSYTHNHNITTKN